MSQFFTTQYLRSRVRLVLEGLHVILPAETFVVPGPAYHAAVPVGSAEKIAYDN